jgi:hypothetical protein
VVDLLARPKELELLLVDANGDLEYFGYALDPLVLRKRAPARLEEAGMVLRCALRAGTPGQLVRLALSRSAYDDSCTHVVRCGAVAVHVGIAFAADAWHGSWPGELQATLARAAVAFPCEQGVQVVLVDLHNGLVVRAFVLEGARRARVRLDDARLLFADDCGRVRVVSAAEGHILRDVRVSA